MHHVLGMTPSESYQETHREHQTVMHSAQESPCDPSRQVLTLLETTGDKIGAESKQQQRNAAHPRSGARMAWPPERYLVGEQETTGVGKAKTKNSGWKAQPQPEWRRMAHVQRAANEQVRPCFVHVRRPIRFQFWNLCTAKGNRQNRKQAKCTKHNYPGTLEQPE